LLKGFAKRDRVRSENTRSSQIDLRALLGNFHEFTPWEIGISARDVRVAGKSCALISHAMTKNSIAIRELILDLDERIGRRSRMRVTVTIHAGRAAVGEVNAVERSAIMAIGDAIDQTNEIRRAVSAHDQRFAISQPAYAMVAITPVSAEQIRVSLPSSTDSIVVLLSASPPRLPQSVERSGSGRVRSALLRVCSRH
jgi:hypothetical protein